MRIELTIGETVLHGTLEDTPAGRDFAGLLPLSVTLSDFHDTERIADLPRRLATAGAPDGTAARAGDLSYYAPWGNLALFYRDYPYSDGLIRLGHLEEPAADTLANLADDTPATMMRANPTDERRESP